MHLFVTFFLFHNEDEHKRQNNTYGTNLPTSNFIIFFLQKFHVKTNQNAKLLHLFYFIMVLHLFFSNLKLRSKTFGLTYVKITQKGPIKKATKEEKKVHFFMIHGTWNSLEVFTRSWPSWGHDWPLQFLVPLLVPHFIKFRKLMAGRESGSDSSLPKSRI